MYSPVLPTRTVLTVPYQYKNWSATKWRSQCISPLNVDLTTSTFLMFSRSIITLSAFAALASAAALDVFVPKITSPTASTVWKSGAVETVTWYEMLRQAAQLELVANDDDVGILPTHPHPFRTKA